MVHFKPTIAVILSDQLQALLPAYLAYVVTIASPGPSNMAILELALRRGRDAALAFAAGVVTVSWTWALLAATSLSAVLFRHPWLLDGVKTVGGLYLLWLGWRAASAAQRSGIHEASERSPETRGLASLYARGVLMHLANPKAVIGWLAVLSLGLTRRLRTIHTLVDRCRLCGALGTRVRGVRDSVLNACTRTCIRAGKKAYSGGCRRSFPGNRRQPPGFVD